MTTCSLPGPPVLAKAIWPVPLPTKPAGKALRVSTYPLEILEDRYGRRSTIVTSQLPVDKWHDRIGDPTLADALLDRLVHNAHQIPLAGETMRKIKTKPSPAETVD